MKYSFRHQRGSILIQVVFSILIFSMGLTGSAALIVAAIESNTMNENRFMATNLAQEGIEVVRTLRDTNWMTYSTNLRECWNFWDDTDENGIADDSDADCTPNADGQNDHPWGRSDKSGGIDQNAFLVDLNTNNFRWNIIPEEKFDDIDGTGGFPDYTDGFRLYEKTTSGGTFYTHDKSGDVTRTKFSRKIYLYYIDNNFDDTGSSCGAGGWPSDCDENEIIGGEFPAGQKANDNRILVISKVTWLHRGVEKNVTISTIMTDFYDRSEWTS